MGGAVLGWHGSGRLPGRALRRVPAALLWVSVVSLVACGEVPSAQTDPEDVVDAGAVAPACDEVDPLQATLPEGTEPAVTEAEPVRDGSAAGHEADRDADDGQEVLPLASAIQAWVGREAADDFAGLWIDQQVGGWAVAFTDEVDRHAGEIRADVHPGLAVAEANHPYGHLRDIQARVGREQMGRGGQEAGAVTSVGVQVMINRTVIGVFDPDEQRLAELSDAYGATAICFEIDVASGPPSDAIETLAKSSGWREGLAETHGSAFAVVEVAYDRDSAEAAWRDNVPDDLAARDDERPAEPGVYGGLDTVDFDRQVVVVWSSGESSGCPAWLADIDSTDGTIHVQEGATAHMECPSDYNPYRLVLAVDRDRLPTADELPSAKFEGVPNGKVRAYLADDR